VRQYILHYSKERDRVLDPFGGSGVTAIEAFLENRIGIQNDINPLANFIAEGIANLAKGNITDYSSALDVVRETCQAKLDELYKLPSEGVSRFKRRLQMPENIPLPRNSDVRQYHELFSERQLAALERYLAKRFYPANADKFIRRLIAACESLGRTPQIGTLRGKAASGMRVVGFERRVAIYFIFEQEQVIIAGLYYGGRSSDPEPSS